MKTCQKALTDKMDEREKQIAMRFDSIDKALIISKREMERRLEGMNEFRAQLERQSRQFLSRTDLDYAASKLENRLNSNDNAIKDLKQEIDRQMGSRRWSDYLIMIALSLIVALITKYFT